MLGTMSDAEAARRIRRSVGAVTMRRRKLGIAKFDRQFRPYTPEAIKVKRGKLGLPTPTPKREASVALRPASGLTERINLIVSGLLPFPSKP